MIQPENILEIDNFEGLPYSKLLEIIDILKRELKKEKMIGKTSSSAGQFQIQQTVSQLKQAKEDLEKYKKVINNYHKILKRPLTVKERLTGKIQINPTNNSEKDI